MQRQTAVILARYQDLSLKQGLMSGVESLRKILQYSNEPDPPKLQMLIQKGQQGKPSNGRQNSV